MAGISESSNPGDTGDGGPPPTTLRADSQATRVRPVVRRVAGATQARTGEAAAHAGNAGFGPGSVVKERFELESVLGSGGMGMVFVALDRRKVEARDPNPRVALKILNPAFAERPEAFIALQRESSKAQSLAHPNIVTVFDFDRDGDTVYFTMELLRGQSLEDKIGACWGSGVGRDAAMPIIRGMAEGLAYAHKKGIVHSDLKPGNVFVTSDGTPKLLDFGIARALPSVDSAGTRDEYDAGALGAYTELYATEEMIQGGVPAAADDLYGLGVVVYELLAGRHPFNGKSMPEAHAATLQPARIGALRRREWRTLCRSLAFDRSARPRDAEDFLREFFKTTWLRNSLAVVFAVSLLSMGFLWYRNYEQSGPSIAFVALPAEVQKSVTADLAEGNKELAFYQEQGIGDALGGALRHFSDAYVLHKGNREAVRGLQRVAELTLDSARKDPDLLRQNARILAEESDYLRSYPPVMEALR